MKPDEVFYNDTWMSADWPARIEAGQRVTTYLINGQSYNRLAYGQERDEWPHEVCHDCGGFKGQYHVPLVCDVEECPRCGAQVIGCTCLYEEDDPREETRTG